MAVHASSRFARCLIASSDPPSLCISTSFGYDKINQSIYLFYGPLLLSLLPEDACLFIAPHSCLPPLPFLPPTTSRLLLSSATLCTLPSQFHPFSFRLCVLTWFYPKDRVFSRANRSKMMECYITGSNNRRRKCTWVHGPIIVGAGPSGMAVAASLSNLGVPSTILEKSDCVASMWQYKTYDRLKLHLPKQFCQLPLMGFPPNFPKYPSRDQFLSYMDSYARRFDINPKFGCTVKSAEYDVDNCCWKVMTVEEDQVFLSRWLVVATGENADPVVPAEMERFGGRLIHSCCYKSAKDFEGDKVLVVGCGNSGMEVSLDLCRNNARPFMVARNSVHVLPREMLGMSTFSMAMSLLKWLPLRLVDKFLVLGANLSLGHTDRLGLRRPKTGPIELKNTTGKTPVLDVGAISQIKSGKIKVTKGVREITKTGAKFVDGKEEDFDSIILATGYKSNVPSWLKESEMFTEEGKPRKAFPNGWKGGKGLYCVGFTLRGLLGTCSDSSNIARDIASQWKKGQMHSPTSSSPVSNRSSTRTLNPSS